MKQTTKNIIIFDTTLRDGEQSPGASMSVNEKLRLARQLVRLGVDVIEAGFPVASEADFEAVKKIAEQVKGKTICALARAVDRDIEVAAKALEAANKKRIHVFIATSEVHMKHKLNMSQYQVILSAVAAVKKAKQFVDEVEFSAEDAARSDVEFLLQVIEAVIDAGASIINIPDTVGYATPEEFGQLINTIKQRVPNIHRATISVHCHNDLGLAVANSLCAIANGAEQVECTVNGIGERSGNCALEEVVMALNTRFDHYHIKTAINKKQILKTSQLVSKITGIAVQPNKAIVGKNSFSHEAGIHQHGVIKHRATYEIMRAEDVGFSSNHLILGKHSGRHAVRLWTKKHGIEISDKVISQLTKKIKQLSDQKKSVLDSDVMQLLQQIKNNDVSNTIKDALEETEFSQMAFAGVKQS